jgi:sugar phosphate isomerase/epimerase
MRMTRREFGILAAGGLVTLSTGRAFAAPKGKADRVIFGVQSYSLRDRPLDEAIEAMKTLGVRTCELWQGHLEPEKKTAGRDGVRKWREETPLSFFQEVRGKFKKAGVDLCAFNYSFRDDYSDLEVERGFAMAKALGVPAITASSNQATVDRVAPLAKKHRIKVAIHNHSTIKPNEFATPEDFEKAITGPGREFIAINLDIGHFTAANFDPVEFLKKHHKRIVTLHIKDRKKDQGDNMPFGEGDTPIKPVLALLRDKGWRIPANIEYEYKGQDTVEEIRKTLEFCRSALNA